MREVNSAWIRGKEEFEKFLDSLLQSGYEASVVFDQESSTVTGKPSYLVTYVDRKYSGHRFVAVNEYDEMFAEEDE